MLRRAAEVAAEQGHAAPVPHSASPLKPKVRARPEPDDPDSEPDDSWGEKWPGFGRRPADHRGVPADGEGWYSMTALGDYFPGDPIDLRGKESTVLGCHALFKIDNKVGVALWFVDSRRVALQAQGGAGRRGLDDHAREGPQGGRLDDQAAAARP